MVKYDGRFVRKCIQTESTLDAISTSPPNLDGLSNKHALCQPCSNFFKCRNKDSIFLDIFC